MKKKITAALLVGPALVLPFDDVWFSHSVIFAPKKTFMDLLTKYIYTTMAYKITSLSINNYAVDILFGIYLHGRQHCVLISFCQLGGTYSDVAW